MKELKFRAFHKTVKEMLYAENHFIFQWSECEKQPIEIMQYTDLHDKNGKEIFEGDVCIIPYFHSDTSRGVIEFINGAFVFNSKEDPAKQVVGWSMICQKEIEVVGNIHENPELLK